LGFSEVALAAPLMQLPGRSRVPQRRPHQRPRRSKRRRRFSQPSTTTSATRSLSRREAEEKWRNSKPQSWADDSDRFFATLSAFDQYLASDAPLGATPERLFQGAVADALTHVGQIARLRRLAGARILGENYSVAKIEVRSTSDKQLPPVREFA
jgi:hypothetical protein